MFVHVCYFARYLVETALSCLNTDRAGHAWKPLLSDKGFQFSGFFSVYLTKWTNVWDLMPTLLLCYLLLTSSLSSSASSTITTITQLLVQKRFSPIILFPYHNLFLNTGDVQPNRWQFYIYSHKWWWRSLF